MGVISYFGKNFYEPLDRVGTPVLGQLLWIPAPQLNPHPYVIEAERTQSTSHASAQARWTTMTDKHFTRRADKALPILGLKLNETEEVIAYKAKRRPAVVVGTRATVFGHRSELDKPHHEENRIVVAPIYGVRTEDDPHGFSSVMASRVRHLLYTQYFPAAEWRESRSPAPPGSLSLEEGIIRFDRLQFASPFPPSCRLVPLRIADDAFALLQSLLWVYLHAEPSETLREMRDVFESYLPDEAKPPRHTKSSPAEH